MADYSSTRTVQGNWTEGVQTIADTINGFLDMRNNMAEKKQKREMQDLQMQQMRMQIQGQQKSMDEQDDLNNKIKSVDPFKKVTVQLPQEEWPEELKGYDPEELKTVYTPEALSKMTTKEVTVPLSTNERLQKIVDIQLQHKAAQDPKFAIQLLKEQRLAEAPKKVVASMQEFEGVTGIDSATRGTPEYTTAFMQFLKEKSSNTQRKYPAFRQDSRLPPGYRFDGYTGETIGPNGKPVDYNNISDTSLAWQGAKKEMLTVKGPTFNRLVRNGEILMEGVLDPATGKRSEPELDKLVRLRNEVDDGVFAQMSSDVRAFNSWDQFLKYQTSDPAMARLKSAIMANAERIGNMYSGGGTVTSDKKIELAKDLLDAPLSKEAFKGLVDMHKESMTSTVWKFSETAKRGGKPNAKPLTDKNLIQVYIRRAKASLGEGATPQQIRDTASSLATKEGYSVEK